MPVDAQLRSLEIDIPAQPQALVKLSLIMAEEDLNLQAASALIEGDMALASAVLRAVNSSMYGLRGRVQSVHQAITYLGLREVAGITFEMGLRAAFPAATQLEPVWRRAAERAWWMRQLASALGQDAWAAHSAGLFEECGKAVLFRHDLARYGPLLQRGLDDPALAAEEHALYGVSHDALGGALCETWGLAMAATASVRQQLKARTQGGQPTPSAQPQVLALSLMARCLMEVPPGAPDHLARWAELGGFDPHKAAQSASALQSQWRERGGNGALA